MSDRVYWYTNTIPANTPPSALFTANMKFTDADVEKIQAIVPLGCAGSVGFQVQNGGGSFVPQSPGQFIVADGYVFDFPQNKAPNNGNWQFVGYNTDYVAHTIQIAFYVNDFTKQSVPSTSLVSV